MTPNVLSCRLSVLLTILLAAGCGGGDGDGGGSPTSPSGPPPSGVASIAGSWSGTSDFQQNGQRLQSHVTATVTQNDRTVQGTLTFTSPGWDGWRGTFSGTLAGTAPDTQFVGDVTIQSNSTTGTGLCIGHVRMAGPSIGTSMRWEAETVNIASNVPTQPLSACIGQVFTLAWIFFR